MKSTFLRVTLAAALALSGITACKKTDDADSAQVGKEPKSGKKNKLKKDGTKKEKKKDKKGGDGTAPATPVRFRGRREVCCRRSSC